MRVVLNTTHLSSIGGAENYLMRLAEALDEISDFYITRNWPDDFVKFNGFGKKFKVYNGLFKPDIFLHCSHFVRHPAIGDRNYAVVLFPKKELKPVGYDGCISICEYSARWTRDYWGTDSFVIEPCIEPALYRVEPKRRLVVSIGHFFEEPDGHSKNQHILCSAFDLPGYELNLIGNANPSDGRYLRKVERAAEGKAIKLLTNQTADGIKSYLAEASHLWHANGYGRSDPGQTEHFGIIVLEAIASGVVPIVHKSGGASEIDGAVTWERPEELPALTLERSSPRRLADRYTVRFFKGRVAEWLKSAH